MSMRSDKELLEDLRRVGEIVTGVPSTSDYREHGNFSVSAYYRHFDGFTDARERAGIDGKVQTGPTDWELIQDLRKVNESVRGTVSADQYSEQGEYAINTQSRRFGSFPEAREAAGIDGDPNAEPRFTDEELLDDVRAVYTELGEPPSESQYKEHGSHSYSTLRERFGPITEIREAADIPNPNKRGGHNEISDSELLDAITELAEELGRPPVRDEMIEYGYSEGPFRRAFGTWNDALRAAGYDPNKVHNKERQEYECDICGAVEKRLPSDIPDSGRIFCSRECLGEFFSENNSGEDHHQYNRVTVECAYCSSEMERKPAVVEKKDHFYCDYDCYGSWCSENRVKDDHPRWKGGGDLYYGPNWQRQRRRRLEKDGHQCQRCGMTNDECKDELGRDLDVHHITPVRDFHNDAEGGSDWEIVNSIDNLVTLCIRCHRKVEKLPVSPQFE